MKNYWLDRKYFWYKSKNIGIIRSENLGSEDVECFKRTLFTAFNKDFNGIHRGK